MNLRLAVPFRGARSFAVGLRAHGPILPYAAGPGRKAGQSIGEAAAPMPPVAVLGAFCQRMSGL